MRIKLMFLGLLFFLNPTYGALDIFPDFIGAIMILASLGGASAVSDRIERCENLLLVLGGVSALRFALFLRWGTFDGSAKMLVSFCLTALEAFLICYLISLMADGMENIKIRYGTVFNNEGKFDIARLKLPLVVYTAFRSALFFLPEATELRLGGKEGINENAILTPYKGLLYFVFTLIILIPLILTVLRVLKTSKGLSKDGAMTAAVESAALEARENYPKRFAEKEKKRCYILFMATAIFSMYFYVDNKNVIPKAAAALFFVLFAFIECERRDRLPIVVPAAALLIFDTAFNMVSATYYDNYSDGSVLWAQGAIPLRIAMSVLGGLQAISLVLAILPSSKVLEKKVLKALLTEAEDDEFVEEKAAKKKRAFLAVRIFAVVLAAAALLFVPLKPYVDMMGVFLTAASLLYLYFSWAV